MSPQTAISQGNVSALPNGSAAARYSLGWHRLACPRAFHDRCRSIGNSEEPVVHLQAQQAPFSGVSTLAILVWFVVWAVLEWCWRDHSLPLKRINIIAFTLLALSLLATFPPLSDLL